MSHGGRPSHDFWKNGDYERRKEGNKIVAFCLICKKSLSNTAKNRLQTHRNMCRSEMDCLNQQCNKSTSLDTNENVIKIIELDSVQPSIAVDADISFHQSKVIAVGAKDTPVQILPDVHIPSLHQEFSNTVLTSSKKQKTQPQKCKIDSYIDYIPNEQKTRIDEALVKFFYGCNIPLKVVESKPFMSFINVIRPAYTPLSAKAMSDEFLNDLHKELEKYQSTLLYSEGVLIITRTEIKQTSHMVGFVQSQEKIIYLKTWDIQQEDNNLSFIINNAITIASIKFEMTIYALITDEDVQLLNADEYKLWILQCNIYFALSVETELVNLNFIEKVHYLLGQFSSQELKKDLIKRGGVTVELENNSIYHNRDLFIACLKNLRVMTQMMGDRQYKFKKDVIDMLIDDSFEEELNHSLDLLKSVWSIIEKCEKSKITIADAAEDWLMLASSENATIKYNNLFQSRINTIILTPITLVANLLHPLYRGKRFQNHQDRMIKVMQVLINALDEERMNDFGKYKSSTGIFESHRLKNYTNAQTYWQAVAPVHPKLSSFAIKILQLPVIVPKLKSYPNNINNLTPNRFEKLTDLFYHLNM